MKNWLLLMFSSLLILLASCQQIDLSQKTSDSRGTLSVACIYGKTDTGFDNARSKTKAVSAVAKRITYIILQNGNVIGTFEQVYGADKKFGSFTYDLNPGTYQLVIFAHNCSDSVRVSSSGIITCPDNKPSDSFCYSDQFTITKDTDTSIECVLERCVSLLYIKSVDVIPDNVTGLVLTLTGPSTAYDGLNMKGYVTDPVVKNITDISYVSDSGSRLSLNTYLFLPESEGQIDVTLQFVRYNQDTQQNETVATRTLSGISLAVNRQSTVNARIFSTSEVNCAISANADWLDPIYQDL